MAETITDTLTRAVNVNVNNNYNKNIVNLTLTSKIAYALARRGYSGSALQYEVERYLEFIKARKEAQNPIGDPVRYLSKWQIFAEPSASPEESGQIADFLEAVQCDDLETICNVESVQLKDGILFVIVKERPILEAVAAVIDKAAADHAGEYRLFMEKIGSKNLYYCAHDKSRINDGRCWIWDRGEWRRVTREYARESGFPIYPNTDNDQLDIYYKNHPNERTYE